MLRPEIGQRLRQGVVIPAHPLALTAERMLDEVRQAALTRYYLAAGAGGIAVGVHTTQFAIRETGLYEHVLRIAAATITATPTPEPVIKVAGVIGPTAQATAEARLAARLGYDLVLVSLGGLTGWSEADLVAHVAHIAGIMPVFGFYLQPSVGGRPLGYGFWRRTADLPGVHAIKIAPFDRYQTIEVVRAVAESSRANEIALYTGNDDNILVDLLTPFRFDVGGRLVEKRIVGGLLGHWAAWTRSAVRLLTMCQEAITASDPDQLQHLLALSAAVTDSNGAFFDSANAFRGCIAGIHEVLRRQGLLAGRWCLDPEEDLSPGQLAEIDRVYAAYPDLNDDGFVRDHLSEWLTPVPGAVIANE